MSYVIFKALEDELTRVEPITRNKINRTIIDFINYKYLFILHKMLF